MEISYHESIAEYTTRFVNKCEQANLELDNLGVVERFAASLTDEVRHQVNASWINTRNDDKKVWSVMTASNIARDLLGDNVRDYYRLYTGGRSGRAVASGSGGSRGEAKNGTSEVVAAAGNKFGNKNKRRMYCKVHGKYADHNTTDCDEFPKGKETRNTFYGNLNMPRVAGSSGPSRVSEPCRYCSKTYEKGHRCNEYYQSDLYKARMAQRQAKQVNAINVRHNNNNGNNSNDNNESLDEDEDLEQYLEEAEECKFQKNDKKIDQNNFKLKTPILLEGQELFAEVDTGSEVTLLNKTTFLKIVPLLEKNYPLLNKKFISPINGYFNFAASNQKLK
jgi:hypothetical protein